MAKEQRDIPERIASVETAVQYLTQAQVDSNARFDRLEAKVDRILFTIIIVGAGLFAASVTTAAAAILTLLQR